MPDAAQQRDPRLIAFLVLVAVVIAGGAALFLTGVGADLSESKDVRLTLYAKELEPEVAAKVAVGDQVFTDPGGMVVGEIVEVVVEPTIEAVPDFEGNLNAAEDPTLDAVRVVIAATGREGNGIVAIDNQVVQAGTQFTLVSRDYVLRGVLTGVEFD